MFHTKLLDIWGLNYNTLKVCNMVSLNLLTCVLGFWCIVLRPFSPNPVYCLSDGGSEKGSTTAKECSMKIFSHVEPTPQFEIGNSPLKIRMRICRLSTAGASNVCIFDITNVFQRRLLKPELFHFVLVVMCKSPLRVVFRGSKHFTKSFFISSLFLKGSCEVTARDLAVWGRATNLGSLYLSDGVFVRDDKNQTASDLKGLFNVNSLVLKGLSSKGIPHMFTSFVWEKMARVEFDNMSLTSIPDVLNRTMPNLQTLMLSNNRLHKPPNFPWCNTRLELPYNLSRIVSGTQRYSQAVSPRMYQRLFFVLRNPDLDISKYEFVSGSLDKISLCGNGLKIINSKILHKISGLKAVDLSANEFKEIPSQTFHKSGGLIDVNLANNHLEFLASETFRELQQLRILDLSNNAIHTLQSGLLNVTENLEEIDLHNNSLKRIEQGALPSGANSFKKINLTRNNLRYIPKATFLAHNLKVFDMSDNVVDFGSFLETLDALDFSELLVSRVRISSRVAHKKVLKLERNNIEQFDLKQFNKARLLKLRMILTAYTLDIKDNPLICDCKVRDLQQGLWNWTIRNQLEIEGAQFDSWMCHTPDDLRGTKVMSIPPEQLKCETQYPKCPVPCKCYKRPPGLPIFVDCRNQNLTEVPNKFPNGLIELRLEYNQIQNLTCYNFLRNVTSLYMSHNKLRRINSSFLHSSKLKNIFMDSNQLMTLPKYFQHMNLSNIDIRNNFFKCDCKNKWMKEWLLQLDEALVGGAGSIYCSSGKNRGKRLISVKDDDFICFTATHDKNVGDKNVNAMIAYILAGLLSIFIIVACFIYRFRGELKVLLFTRLRWHPFDNVDDSDPSKIYDAFVSYSSRDMNWVMHTLRENLENGDQPYKLCIHDRDFLAGAPIFQNIFDSVKSSRRMIMVLSKNFIQSEWCMLEFRAAHQRVLQGRRNYLIVVLLDEVDTKNLDDELKLYLRTNTYLNTKSKWFWQQLKYALPQNGLCTSQTWSLMG